MSISSEWEQLFEQPVVDKPGYTKPGQPKPLEDDEQSSRFVD